MGRTRPSVYGTYAKCAPTQSMKGLQRTNMAFVVTTTGTPAFARSSPPISLSIPSYFRYGRYPKPNHLAHPLDCSVMKYRGHAVLQTLIRCHFSPAETTGGRYIYSGSADGRIHVRIALLGPFLPSHPLDHVGSLDLVARWSGSSGPRPEEDTSHVVSPV